MFATGQEAKLGVQTAMQTVMQTPNGVIERIRCHSLVL
jgi:hypothetical protein